ncbi:hypothetical protein S83_040348 [Arachis hypogaea]|uniref:F-box domain-containing protein n=1 Tax=Arachis hypogaea TaxID=3818 RepID=A0A445E818_ARAHY|nr:hypothetical protein Ahy_A02g005691 [Arachis hypogaea]
MDRMDLLLELWELIFQRLCLNDIMNFRATCRSWQKAADAIFSSQLPFMLSLSLGSPNNFGSLSVPWSNHYSTVLTEKWPREIDSSSYNKVFLVQGWLVFNLFHYELVKGQTFSELLFFNPFSRARFKLPKLFLFYEGWCHYQVRVAFNSAPPGSEEFVVAFLIVVCKVYNLIGPEHRKQRLAFIRFKQGSWIESIETDELFYDIEVHDNNKLYGLTFKHGTSVVFVFTLGDNHGDDHVVERLVMLNTIEEGIDFSKLLLSDEFFKRSHQMVMDTSTGELLIVRHLRSRCYDTEGFTVFKLDRKNLKWCEVFDIGDRFLFWDYTKVSLVSAKGLRLAERFKRGNCIFFCHANTPLCPYQPQYRYNGFKEYDIGVFFLADRTISHFLISSSLPISRWNMWFSPAP